MSLDDVLQLVQKAFKPRKPVDFPELGLHFEVEPLTSTEEIKVLEAIKDFEGAAYTEALKRYSLAIAIKKMNDISFENDEVTYLDNGEKKTKTKFLFLIDYIGKWPNAFISDMFDAFTNILVEVDDKIRKNMKFERYTLAEAPEPEKQPGGLRRVRESEPTDAVEKLNQAVQQEVEQANSSMSEAVTKAEEATVK